jgi:hypothetical protein
MRSLRWVAVAVVWCVGCADTVEGTGTPPGGNGGTSSGSSGTTDPYENNGQNGTRRPPPVISSISPLEGDYGTEVTITGDNFDDSTAQLALSNESDAPITYTNPNGGTTAGGEAPNTTAAAVITKWSKTEIKFRYPFPADGTIRMTSKSGQAEGGSFVPTWKPGRALSGSFARRVLLNVVSPAPKTIVAAFDGATGPMIVVGLPDGSLTQKSFDRGSAALTTMSLYVTPSGGVEGFFSRDGSLWRLTDAMGSPTTATTGVTAAFAAGGQDATGPYAWIKSGATLSRVRPPSWTAETTAADPTPSGAPGPSIAVSPDHSLIVGWGVNSTGSFPLYDHTTSARAARLRVGMTTFDAAKSVGGGADDYMVWTRFRAGPEGRIASYFCANDTGMFASTTVDCREGYVGAGTTPSYAQLSDVVVGYNATTAVIAACDTTNATMKTGPETQTAQQTTSLFPCPSIVAVAADPSGAAGTLVTAGKYLYAPHKR